MPSSGQKAVQLLLAVSMIMFCTVPAAALELVGGAVGSGSRIALIIAQADAGDIPAVMAGDDATSLTSDLGAIGFDVQILLDRDRAAIDAGLERFRELAQSADMALIFFAGNTVVAGDALRLPTGDTSAEDAPQSLLSVEDLTTAVAGARSLGLVIVDVPWGNPFAGGTRLGDLPGYRSGPPTAPGGRVAVVTVVSDPPLYSEARSPLVAGLRPRLDDEDTSIAEILEGIQTRGTTLQFVGLNLLRTSFFIPPVTPEEVPSVEAQFWETIAETDNPDELRSYLRLYPEGEFRADAEARIAYLEGDDEPVPVDDGVIVLADNDAGQNDDASTEVEIDPVDVDDPSEAEEPEESTETEVASLPPDEAPTETIEVATRLDPAQLSDAERRAIQQDLRRLGYYNSVIDGLFGPGTARAITLFQQSIGADPIGALTPAEREVLQIAAANAPDPSPPPAPEPVSTPPDPVTPDPVINEPVTLPTPAAVRYAALAISSPPGSHGLCIDRSSEFDARRCAQNQCGALCNVVATGTSGTCMAYAESSVLGTVAGYGYGGSIGGAQANAMAMCEANAQLGGCQLIAAQCQP